MSARIILSGLLLTWTPVVVAASAAAETVVTVTSSSPRPVRIDESALRYYAAQKQTARVEAETQRLKRLFPDWSPPRDLWTAKPGNPDDAPLWDLFAADKIDDLRIMIAARRAKDANWTLPTDLAQKLRRKDDRAALLANAKAKRWSDVAAAAQSWLGNADSTDVEVLWQIAEAFAQTRRTGDAQQILDGILQTSTAPQERIATVQKALGLLPMSSAERMIDGARRDDAGRSEFAGIAIDITRARISAFLRDAPGRAMTTAELATFQTYATSASDPNQIALLAWHALKRGEIAEALEHFKSSIAKGGDAMVAHGLAQTLKRARQLREAEEVAYAWREPSVANGILFIDILADQLTQESFSIDAKRLTRYAEVTLQTSSGEGAQALGWYAYNSCQLDAAAEWFRRAVAWMPKETTVFGYALTLRRLKKTQDYIEIVNRYDGLFPKVVALMYPEALPSNDPCNRGAQAVADPLARRMAGSMPVRSLVPLPSLVGRGVAQDVAGPKKSEFPIVTSLENPYRASPERLPSGKATSGPWRPASPIAAVTDARRVFGAGPMPYERYGKTLLPGLNGLTQPSLSQDFAVQSPRGTLWSDERIALDAASTRATPPAQAVASSAIIGTSSSTRFHP